MLTFHGVLHISDLENKRKLQKKISDITKVFHDDLNSSDCEELLGSTETIQEAIKYIGGNKLHKMQKKKKKK